MAREDGNGRGSDADGFDPYDSVADRIAEPPPATTEDPEKSEPLPKPPTKKILVILAGVLAIVFLRTSSTSPTPRLDADCTTPAFALSMETAEMGSPVEWTVVGPASERFALAVDAAGVQRGPTGRLTAQPAAGLTLDDVQLASELEIVPTGCRATGLFGVRVRPGEHTVTLFRLAGGSAQALTTTRLVVEEPH